MLIHKEHPLFEFVSNVIMIFSTEFNITQNDRNYIYLTTNCWLLSWTASKAISPGQVPANPYSIKYHSPISGSNQSLYLPRVS